MFGASDQGTGVWGQSNHADGVWGQASAAGKSGVVGIHTDNGHGVYGKSVQDAGVFGESTQADGVWGQTSMTGRSGVVGIHTGNGNGVYGRAPQAGHAAWFDGNVMVTGVLNARIDITIGADCAEEFDIVETMPIEPGTVMVIDAEGALCQSEQAYDKRVAGVVSGAGDLQPGITLDKSGSPGYRLPIALIGKVYCKVDAEYSSIEVGDLLTTSPTPGHAMKADNPLQAFGAVIGKALRPLQSGQGLIPILIALQ